MPQRTRLERIMFEWKPVSPFVQKNFWKYEALRPIYISEGHYLNQFLWENYYQTRFAMDQYALYLSIRTHGHHGAFAPLCREEDLPAVFSRLEDEFHRHWNEPARFYNIDTTMVKILEENDLLTNYEVSPDRDSFDYIYDADKLRTLSGKAMHKKKNLLNGFVREYEGHFEYETLGINNIEEIESFHQKWLDERRTDDKYNCLDDEEDGIYRLFGNCHSIQCKMGGVRIDGELKAYSIGSYVPHLKLAIIHIEKADVSYHGLYNYINQQFILNEFPEAQLVNREDDLGQENLRQAKLSYRPLRLEEKFSLVEKTG